MTPPTRGRVATKMRGAANQIAGLCVSISRCTSANSRRRAPASIVDAIASMRRSISASHGEVVAAALRILYGGSVKPDNIGSLMGEPDLDGALVGGASLDAQAFLKIVHFRRA